MVSMLLTNYLEANSRISPATRYLTRRAFQLLEAAVDVEISDFSYEHAERFQKFLASRLSETSCNIFVKTVSPCFSWLVRRGDIPKNPFSGLKLFKPRRNRINIYEPHEFRVLLDCCPSKLWQARIMLGKTAGLRRGEVLSLCRENLGQGVIHVEPKEADEFHWEWRPKSRNIRSVPLIQRLAELLDEIGAGLPPHQPYLMLTADRYRKLLMVKDFMSDSLKNCPDSAFNKEFIKIRQLANVNKTFHDLRRTFVTEMLEGGLRPHQVMVLAGHASVQTTLQFYTAQRSTLLDQARSIGATGFEPATS